MTKIKQKGVYTKYLVSSLLVLLQALFNIASAEQSNTDANNIALSISPEQCIALHQGQVCYQNVIIEWRADRLGDFCLYPGSIKTPVRCWQNVTTGKLAFDFQSEHSINYVLRASNSDLDLATVQMTVAWVYGNKKRRRASWRLF